MLIFRKMCDECDSQHLDEVVDRIIVLFILMLQNVWLLVRR